MTEAIKAGGPAILAGMQDAGRRSGKLPSDALTFHRALEDGRQEQSAASLRPGEEGAGRHDWQIKGFLERLSLPQEAGQDAPDNEMPGVSDEGMLRLSLDASLGQTPQKRGAEPAQGNSKAAAELPLRMKSTAARGEGTGVAAKSEDTPDRVTEASGAATKSGTALAKRIGGVEAAGAEAPEAALRPPAERPAPPRAASGGEPLLQADKARAHEALAARIDGARADGARERNPDAEPGADDGKKPFRVVNVQTAPAPATGSTTSGTGSTGGQLVTSLEADPVFRSTASEAAQAAAGTFRRAETLHVMKIQLQPAELGMVTARLTVSGEQLSVELQVETADARQRLHADGEAITRALRALGYEIDRITVQQAPQGTNVNAGTTGREQGFQPGPGSGEQQSGAANSHREGGNGNRGARPAEGHDDAETGGDLYI
ncbi:flagellar hook-length control protein FliK [Chelativorans sp. M5D2P16]|uniref:flagellar hook-length control protein FliK n=1 Tax=Chelativorans sp. M5D2P16 TaxID=3095678 RepID=UPI002ACA93CB|nr:flagellar hook-length control protein FliK [Chelativorans sp. M5D2P16]MDZ5698455.1 flagellar hook-length control protein FliK [Chelativorans sp. M5D2P16]